MGRQSSRLCRFSSTGSTRSPETEEVLRQPDVRWRADGRCTQSIRRILRFARPFELSSLDVSQTDVFHLFFSSLEVASSTTVADFSVTVSSNEARHILI